MWILALESSADGCGAAVGDGRAWHVREARGAETHSERLLPLVGAVLAAAGLSLGRLGGVAFAAGPGSFTGVRIGCGVAQGLAFGAGLPALPVATLEALAQEARRAHGARRVVACLDARMREVYAAICECAGDAWRTGFGPVVAKPDALALPAGSDDAFGAGNGFAAFPGLAQAWSLRGVDAALRPTARAVGELAWPRIAAGEGVAAGDALPVYVRHRVALTSAERDAGVRL